MSLKIVIFVFVSTLWTVYFRFCTCDDKQYVTIYRPMYQGDDGFGMDISQCTNLPVWMADGPSYILTKGYCARIFEKQNCIGNLIEIRTESPVNGNLGAWRINNGVRSIASCGRDCSSEVLTGNMPNNELFDNIEIFRKSIEPGQDTYFHDDLFKREMVQSKSTNQFRFKSNDDNVSSEILWRGDVAIVYHVYFQENFVKVNTNDSQCYNVSLEVTTSHVSVQIGDSTCISLYNQRGCVGKSLNVIKSYMDLSKGKFRLVRSLKSCGNLGDDGLDQFSIENKTENVIMDIPITSDMRATQLTDRSGSTETLSPEIKPTAEYIADNRLHISAEATTITMISGTAIVGTSREGIDDRLPVNTNKNPENTDGRGSSMLVVVLIILGVLLVGLTIIYLSTYKLS